MVLPSLTVLDGVYAIQRKLETSGPFSVAYMGWHIEEERQVVIREYFPEHLAQRASDKTTVEPVSEQAASLLRAGLKYFLKEAAVLSKIEHEHLIGEHAPIKANGTAYRISDYHPGTTLATALEKRGGKISKKAALTVMQPILDVLHMVHEEGLLHGGITPEAIYLAKSRRTLLMGFRSAHIQLARKSDHLVEVLAPGYSPPEQYTAEGKQGPWTDVYAAAATFYRMITGERLPEANTRAPEDPVPGMLASAEALSEELCHVLAQGLALDPKQRVRSAKAFGRLLVDPPSVDTASSEEPDESKVPGEAAKDLQDDTPQYDKSVEEATPSDVRASDSFSFTGSLSPAEGRKEPQEKEPKDIEVDGPASEAVKEPSGLEAPSTRTSSEEGADASGEKEGEGQFTKSEIESSSPEHENTDEEAEQPRVTRGPVRPQPRKKKFLGRVALTIGVTVLVAALGSSVLLFSGDSSEREAERYESLRAEGDSLFDQADYEAARSRYAEALKIESVEASEEDYLERRLQRIDRLQRAAWEENYKEQMALGDSMRAQAEKLFQNGDEEANDFYARANEAYLAALENRPDDSLAFAQAQEMNRILTVGRDAVEEVHEEEVEELALDPDEMRDQLFARYREQGDALFEAEDYEAAQRKFREALDYQPEDAYVQARLDSIRVLLSNAAREEQFERYRQQGDELFDQGRYAEARREYELALEAQPNSAEVRARIEEIDSLRAEEERNQQQYQYYRAQGDMLFEQEQFQEAIEKYQTALAYRPDDTHAEERIEESQRAIEETGQAEEHQEKEEEQQEVASSEEEVYTVVDTQPELIGGLRALHQRVNYPERAVRRGIEGRVVVQMIVDENGRVQDPKVIKGIGGGCDREALRVVEEAEFEPATRDGEPVSAQHSVWIQFRLEDHQEE